MKNCPKCNAQVKDDVKFCNFCGFNIKKHEEENAQAVQSEFCPECGAKISEGAFCPECGYKLGKEEKKKKAEPLFDFSEDTAKYADETSSGFDEQIKKYEEGAKKAEAAQKALEEAEKKAVEEKKAKELAERKEKAEKLYLANKFDEAFPLCLELAEAGDALFQGRVGYCYDTGSGVKKDIKKAVYWYEKGADGGSSHAQNNLGCLYKDGEGVVKDVKKALELYHKSAEQGYKAAQYNLGAGYYYEWFGVKDVSKAIYWTKKAAEQDYVKAQLVLGDIYFDAEEKYVKMNNSQKIRESYKWYKRAADSGDAQAQYEFGVACFSSKFGDEFGYEIDGEGYEYLVEASRQGHKGAREFINYDE